MYAEQRNEHVLRRLLGELHASLDDRWGCSLQTGLEACPRGVWGSHLGSETLQRSHTKSRRRIACISKKTANIMPPNSSSCLLTHLSAAVEKRKSEVSLASRDEDQEVRMTW